MVWHRKAGDRPYSPKSQAFNGEESEIVHQILNFGGIVFWNLFPYGHSRSFTFSLREQRLLRPTNYFFQ
jgi:hypothetical protein